MGDKKREMFVFVGRNVPIGTPHPITGRTSYYGFVLRIDGTLKQAREFAHDKYHYAGNNMCIPGGRRKMREYCLGMSMRAFDKYLNECPTVSPADNDPVGHWHIG